MEEYGCECVIDTCHVQFRPMRRGTLWHESRPMADTWILSYQTCREGQDKEPSLGREQTVILSFDTILSFVGDGLFLTKLSFRGSPTKFFFRQRQDGVQLRMLRGKEGTRTCSILPLTYGNSGQPVETTLMPVQSFSILSVVDSRPERIETKDSGYSTHRTYVEKEHILQTCAYQTRDQKGQRKAVPEVRT